MILATRDFALYPHVQSEKAARRWGCPIPSYGLPVQIMRYWDSRDDFTIVQFAQDAGGIEWGFGAAIVTLPV